MTKRFKLPAYHAHGCTTCGLRYGDACATPGDNDTCMPCRLGTPRVETGFDPAPCCGDHSRPVTDPEVLARYALGGPGPWWQCRRCFRSHPFDPARPDLPGRP
jgi:hypothetical protein